MIFTKKKKTYLQSLKQNLYVFATSITSFADNLVRFKILEILLKIEVGHWKMSSGSLVTRGSLV
jgi:hypothetical protein